MVAWIKLEACFDDPCSVVWSMQGGPIRAREVSILYRSAGCTSSVVRHESSQPILNFSPQRDNLSPPLPVQQTVSTQTPLCSMMLEIPTGANLPQSMDPPAVKL